MLKSWLSGQTYSTPLEYIVLGNQIPARLSPQCKTHSSNLLFWGMICRIDIQPNSQHTIRIYGSVNWYASSTLTPTHSTPFESSVLGNQMPARLSPQRKTHHSNLLFWDMICQIDIQPNSQHTVRIYCSVNWYASSTLTPTHSILFESIVLGNQMLARLSPQLTHSTPSE